MSLFYVRYSDRCVITVLGSRTGFHDWTFGLIMDRLVQKIDPKHRSISDIFTEEVAKPLGLL